MIEILGWATDKATARQFLGACNVATYNATTQEMECKEGFSLHPYRASDEINVPGAPGVHFNLRIYGAPEQALIDAAYDPMNPDEKGALWSRLKLVNYVTTKLGSAATAVGKSLTGARLPIGYEWTIGAKTVRLYDASKVNNRADVWA